MKRMAILLTPLSALALTAPANAAGPAAFPFAPLIGLVLGNLLTGTLLLLLAGGMLAALLERLKMYFAAARRKRLVIRRSAFEPAALRVPVATPRSTGRRYRRRDA